jgi:hypothetical protein
LQQLPRAGHGARYAPPVVNVVQNFAPSRVVGEHRASGERKYYLSNLPADADLPTLAATIKARSV